MKPPKLTNYHLRGDLEADLIRAKGDISLAMFESNISYKFWGTIRRPLARREPASNIRRIECA